MPPFACTHVWQGAQGQGRAGANLVADSGLGGEGDMLAIAV
jgi:hypothetical protein